MSVKFKTITPDAETNIVEIARASSTRKDKTEAPEGLINYLIKNNHWSPFEHSCMTVEIQTSRAIGTQLLRHRSFTFQEFSQRYAKVSGIEDIEFRMQADSNRQSSISEVGAIKENGYFIDEYSATQEQKEWLQKVVIALQDVRDLYDKGLELGIAKECARFILPLASTTTIYMTGTIRSWIHFIKLRDDGHAQKEAQIIGREIKQIFIEQMPIISKALGYI